MGYDIAVFVCELPEYQMEPTARPASRSAVRGAAIISIIVGFAPPLAIAEDFGCCASG